MKLVPLFDRVVLKQLVAEETTKSGIVLPGQAKEKPQQAEVIAVGPGGVVDGKEIKMQVKPGDRNTIVCDERSTEGFVENNVSSFRSDRYANGISKFIYTSFKSFSGFNAIFNFLSHVKIPPIKISCNHFPVTSF